MSRRRKHTPRRQKGQPTRRGASSPEQFFAQPPPPGVSNEAWSLAFLEAQSPDPRVRQRGRDALTEMGCAFMDGPPPDHGT